MDIEEFADKYSRQPKIVISDLTEGTIVYLLTEHSCYTLEIINPSEGKVIATGGYFKRRSKEPCTTYVIGSTMGGSSIFSRQLIEGLFCEFENNVVTSTIKNIFINHIN